MSQEVCYDHSKLNFCPENVTLWRQEVCLSYWLYTLRPQGEHPVHSSCSGWPRRRMDKWMDGRTWMNGCQGMGWHGWILVCVSVNFLKLFLAWALMLIFQSKLPHKIQDINLSETTHSILYKKVFIFYLTFIQNYLAEIQI